MIKEYMVIRLRTGEEAVILEILEAGVAYMAEINPKDEDSCETITIAHKDIIGIFDEVRVVVPLEVA